jgi:hypothetical protein
VQEVLGIWPAALIGTTRWCRRYLSIYKGRCPFMAPPRTGESQCGPNERVHGGQSGRLRHIGMMPSPTETSQPGTCLFWSCTKQRLGDRPRLDRIVARGTRLPHRGARQASRCPTRQAASAGPTRAREMPMRGPHSRGLRTDHRPPCCWIRSWARYPHQVELAAV